MTRPLLLSFLLSLLVLPQVAIAQPKPEDVQWQSGFHLSGLDGDVRAMTVWDGDLVVAGDFRTAGSITVQGGIVLWNGTSWQSLEGPGGLIQGLTVYDGELIAGGTNLIEDPDTSVKYNVVAWDGASWTPVGPGTFTFESSAVRCVGVYGGRLIAGGAFTSMGGVAASNIAQWDGTSWAPLGTGIVGGPSPEVEAVGTFGTELVAGGAFTQAGGAVANGIARWDGTTWRPIGTLSGTCYDFAEGNGTLYAMGSWSTPTGPTGWTVARWDGAAWSFLTEGMDSQLSELFDITVSNGTLFAAARLSLGNAVFAGIVEAWNGSQWAQYGSTMDEGVSCLATLGGSLVAGGAFDISGNLRTRRVARWEGADWTRLDSPGNGIAGDAYAAVACFAEYGGDVIAGGWFSEAGDTPVSAIARWDGTSWHPLGTGLNGGVWALAVYQDELVAAGAFTEAGGNAVQGLAIWNGSTWRAFPGGVSGGADPAASALLVQGGDLYVGGTFAQAGAVPAQNIARWDGGAWHALGSGTNGPVWALTGYGRDVVAGGSFTQAGFSIVNGVAQWTGTEWLRVGNGISGYSAPSTRALTTWNGTLYAAGQYQPDGSPAGQGVLFRFDDPGWTVVDTGPALTILALAPFGTNLAVAGNFGDLGASTSANIARWDGTSWGSFGSGVTDRPYGLVYALWPSGESLWVGGDFDQAGHKPSSDIAIWQDGTVPVTLLAFVAVWEGDGAQIRWQVSGAESGVRFSLYRETGTKGRTWVADATWAPDGTYSLQDPEAPREGATYWLAGAGRDGSVIWHGPTFLPAARFTPRTLHLAQNRPNPVRGVTTIAFDLPQLGKALLAVYDLSGRRVAVLVDEDLPAGQKTVSWNGRDTLGRRVAPGVYVYRLRVDGNGMSRKLLVLP